MRTIFKWLGIIVGGLLVVAIIAVGVLYAVGRGKLNKQFDVQVEMIPIPDDAAAVTRGEHLVTAVAPCIGCHGPDLGGEEFINDPSIGLIYSANLTRGRGGAGASFTDEDWIRAIAYGVDPQGKGLLVMPSQNYHQMSDEDLGAVIAYVKSVPPVDRESPEMQLTFMATLLNALGAFGELPADQIDQGSPRPLAPAPGVNADYGGYLVTIGDCRGCHGANLAGAQVVPSDPWAPNLTPGSELSGWSEADFLTLIRTGKKPSGAEISKKMPYELYRGQTDDEVKAIWVYLSSLEPLPENPR